VAGEHRIQLQGYGLPLPPLGVIPGSPRVARVPGLLARVAGRLVAQRPPGAPPPGPPPTPQGVARPTWFRLPRWLQRRPVEPAPVGPRVTYDPRSILSVIVLSSRNRQMVRIVYRAATKRDLVITRDVEFYSIRYRDTKHGGRRRYLYGFCDQHQKIHSFIVERIMSAEPLPRRFTPRWVVEF
jgi:hypothetical protein